MFAQEVISVPGAPELWAGTRLGLVWLGVYHPDLPFLPERSYRALALLPPCLSVTLVCYACV